MSRTLDKARIFVCTQRIQELKKANKNWPDSSKFQDRRDQIECLEDELKRIANE